MLQDVDTCDSAASGNGVTVILPRYLFGGGGTRSGCETASTDSHAGVGAISRIVSYITTCIVCEACSGTRMRKRMFILGSWLDVGSGESLILLAMSSSSALSPCIFPGAGFSAWESRRQLPDSQTDHMIYTKNIQDTQHHPRSPYTSSHTLR
jgi:hypothetical protein